VSYNWVHPSSGLKVPRKIRQRKSDLKKAGFVERPGRGKGSHTFWVHSEHTGVSVTIAGRDGDDAQGYQEKQVREAVVLAQLADER
jgi:predicted RNA binding protein YcfA (HicA-like mRNA interferase family)